MFLFEAFSMRATSECLNDPAAPPREAREEGKRSGEAERVGAAEAVPEVVRGERDRCGWQRACREPDRREHDGKAVQPVGQGFARLEVAAVSGRREGRQEDVERGDEEVERGDVLVALLVKELEKLDVLVPYLGISGCLSHLNAEDAVDQSKHT